MKQKRELNHKKAVILMNDDIELQVQRILLDSGVSWHGGTDGVEASGYSQVALYIQNGELSYSDITFFKNVESRKPYAVLDLRDIKST